LNTTLAEEDPVLMDLIEKEKWRQYSCLELIASEVPVFFLVRIS
jgi:glycine hydroxymethyltransferase